MKLSDLLELLDGMLKREGDIVLSPVLFFKDELEFLANREFTDVEWAWLAEDLMANHSLDQRDVESYVEALDYAVENGEVENV